MRAYALQGKIGEAARTGYATILRLKPTEEGSPLYELRTEACFDSAHFLADYHGKCENLHGHRWRMVVRIAQDTLGEEGTERDMVIDFGAFKRRVRALAGEFDHTFLVEAGTLQPATVRALESEGFVLKVLPFRTTAENLARHFFDRLSAEGLPVASVEVYETPLNGAAYRADGTVSAREGR